MPDTLDATPSLGVSLVLRLPGEMSVYTVASLRIDWLEWLQAVRAEGGQAAVDGAGVAEVDAAGAQMLLALSHSLAATGQALVLRAPSEALQLACRTLGLERLLQTAQAA